MPSHLWQSQRPRGLPAAVFLLPLLFTSCTMAVHVTVHDQVGRPLKDAVVYAAPEHKRRTPAAHGSHAIMVVDDFGFAPPVLPVRIGTGVSFLNRDDIGHQLYSISPARSFELVVDRLAASPEVVFDKPGAVVVGCSAHDGMIGHICVLESPYFARTGADGKAELDGLPRDAYAVRAWHPDIRDAVPVQRVVSSSGTKLDFRVNLQSGRQPERLVPSVPVPKEHLD